MKKVERGIISSHELNIIRNKVIYLIIFIVVLLMILTMLYPISVTILNAFKTNKEVISFPPTFWPTSWQYDSWSQGWHYIDLLLYGKNTFKIFIGNMLSIVIVLGLAAYSLSKLHLPKRKWVILFFMTTLFIPPTTYIIPNFINIRDLGLMNTFWAFWLPVSGNAFYLLLIKSFFDDIHNEMFEAARIDGASELRSFLQIAFPLSIPIFATLGIFTFANAWNDWFWPSLILHGDNYPLATAIYQFVINANRLHLNVKFAILTMVMIPPIIIFLIFQKYIMRGLTLAGIKE